MGDACAHRIQHQLMLNSMHSAGAMTLRTTINIDDDLLARAAKLAGSLDRSALIHEGLKAFIERESAKRLARAAHSRT
jgi:Arc/MetJ family transcription regulator